jgi:hypothetical protein
VPDQEAQLAALGREWPRPTWLPERVKLCDLDVLWTRVKLDLEGEGRYYNQVRITVTRYAPPKEPGQVSYGWLFMEIHGAEVRRTLVRYGFTHLTWPLGEFWIQLSWLGAALDDDEAVRIVEGIILPPAQNE